MLLDIKNRWAIPGILLIILLVLFWYTDLAHKNYLLFLNEIYCPNLLAEFEFKSSPFADRRFGSSGKFVDGQCICELISLTSERNMDVIRISINVSDMGINTNEKINAEVSIRFQGIEIAPEAISDLKVELLEYLHHDEIENIYNHWTFRAPWYRFD